MNKYQEAHPEWFDEKGRVKPEVLRQLIDYNPETGEMRWRERGREWFCGKRVSGEEKRWNTRYARSLVSQSLNSTGTLSFRLLGREVSAPQIAIAITCGHHCRYIEFKNGNRSDVSLKNLIPSTSASIRQGLRYFQFGKNKTSNFHGVHRRKDGRYRATISVNGSQITIGDYKTEQEAADAYDLAALKYLGHSAYLNLAESPDVEPSSGPTAGPSPISEKEAKPVASDDF